MMPRTSSSLLAIVLSAVALSACGSSSSRPGPGPGVYVTTIVAPRTLTNGKWTLTLRSNGSYTIQERSNFGVQLGKGSLWRGDRLVATAVEPQTCEGGGSGIGTYKLKLAGSALTLSPESKDPCKLREEVLGRTFTKVR